MPLLFIHGGYGGPHSSLWAGGRLQWTADTGGFRTIAYDRRCAGASEYVGEPFTLQDTAADARALLDHLGAAEAVLVASSAGGPVALEFALAWPQRVRALALVNTGTAIMHEAPAGLPAPHSSFVRDRLATVRRRAETVARYERDGMDAAVASCWEEWRTPPPRDIDGAFADEDAHLARALAALPDEECAAYASGAVLNMRAALGVDFAPRLAALRVPAYVTHGDHDTVVPFEYGQLLAQLLPGATFEAVPGAGHGLLRLPEVQASVLAWARSVLG